MEYRNRLSESRSPYLRQHQDNPVAWYPWGEEAFEAARSSSRPILLSIGYATCHWCHVMAHESFEDAEVASQLNEAFICIKVDREEHPDVDHIYMTALQATGRSGGWPLTAFLTPDLEPFFMGTYFPKPHFLNLLERIRFLWQTDRERIEAHGKQFHEGLEQHSSAHGGRARLSPGCFATLLNQAVPLFDARHGGFGSAPKFPGATQLRVLLRIHHRTGSPLPLHLVETTLEGMARGGIYDHLGGGFARYSTDEAWVVPHFEKMLYDNALLSLTYLEAYQVRPKPLYAEVARETLTFVLRELTTPDGGFCSALDADSEGSEGRFYVWYRAEVEGLLRPEEAAVFCDVFGVTDEGHLEGASVLHLQRRHPWEMRHDPRIAASRKVLFAARSRRTRPLLDDKVLTGWNGLMISAMAKGYTVLGEPQFLEAAQRAASFLRTHLDVEGALGRRYRDGERLPNGTLEDHAYLIEGLLNLYEADFNPDWLSWAVDLQERQDQGFWDEARGGYYAVTAETKALLFRAREFTEGAIPNPNGVSALNLLRLYHLYYRADWRTKAERTLEAAGPTLERAPGAFDQMLMALDFYLDDVREVAVVSPPGESLPEVVQRLHRAFIPGRVLAHTTAPEQHPVPLLKGKVCQGDLPTGYVCREFECQAPSTQVDVLLEQAARGFTYHLESKGRE